MKASGVLRWSCSAFLVLSAGGAHAESERQGDGSVPDTFELRAYGETHARLFRRALLPGPAGALVQTETLLPVQQYLALEVSGLDTPLGRDTLDFELAGWGRAHPTEPAFENTYDGDLQTAFVTLKHDVLWLRLGRQQIGGGAARFSRFDGFAVGVRISRISSAEAYAGFSVLPRWNELYGYYHLGAAADSLLRSPEALAEPERSEHWVAGARFGLALERARASLSFHERRETGGVAERNLGLDGNVTLFERASLAAAVLLAADARSLADFRVWGEAEPLNGLFLVPEYTRAEPALLLSRQSVLSVFATDAYQELGGRARLRASDQVSLGAGGWLEFYGGSRPGTRLETNLRLAVDRASRTLVLLRYGRTDAIENGYHSLRVALARRIAAAVSGTLDAYAYFYDEPIQGYTTSSVYSGTLSYLPWESLEVLWGVSLARSPYARFDAQTLVRLSYALEASPGKNPW
jgi:hypothetical protein